MIELKNINVSYNTSNGIFTRKKKLKAIEDINLTLGKGEVVGLVGESGCGKSTLGKTILRLLKEESGSIFYKGQDITNLKNKKLQPIRRKIQAIFQDPYASLNPNMNIFEIISEGLQVFENLNKNDSTEKVANILAQVNINENVLERYPHEFSGGQRQRIAIARALILNPEYVVCDEVVSALDVSTQAQIINLLIDMKVKQGLGYLFISHDLNVVKYISDKIAVMYLGKIVEFANADEINENAFHPYTIALFSSIFNLNNRKKVHSVLSGEVPGILSKPTGCYFHTRCPSKMDICQRISPEYKEIKSGHYVLCHLHGK